MRVTDKYLEQMMKGTNQKDSVQINKSVRKNSQNSKSVIKNLSGRKRKTKDISWWGVFFVSLCLAIAYGGYEHSDEIDKLISKIDFGFFTSAVAESSPKETSEKAKHEQKSPDKPEQSQKELQTKESAESANGIDLDFVKDFKERKKNLDEKEASLKDLESEIQNQKVELEKRLSEIETIRKQISSQLEEKVKADASKVDTLVQVYSQMKPSQAAKIFENLDEDLAIEILSKMKKKNAADILNIVKSDKAQVLSERYAGYRRKPAHTDSGKNGDAKSEENKTDVNKTDVNKTEENKNEHKKDEVKQP